MPKLSCHVFCCVNRRPDDEPRGCCASKNADELRDYMKARVKALGIKQTRVNASGCLDQCQHGPVMVIYPQGIWYHYRTKADIDRIIDEHLIGQKVCDDLRLV